MTPRTTLLAMIGAVVLLGLATIYLAIGSGSNVRSTSSSGPLVDIPVGHHLDPAKAPPAIRALLPRIEDAGWSDCVVDDGFEIRGVNSTLLLTCTFRGRYVRTTAKVHVYLAKGARMRVDVSHDDRLTDRLMWPWFSWSRDQNKPAIVALAKLVTIGLADHCFSANGASLREPQPTAASIRAAGAAGPASPALRAAMAKPNDGEREESLHNDVAAWPAIMASLTTADLDYLASATIDRTSSPGVRRAAMQLLSQRDGRRLPQLGMALAASDSPALTPDEKLTLVHVFISSTYLSRPDPSVDTRKSYADAIVKPLALELFRPTPPEPPPADRARLRADTAPPEYQCMAAYALLTDESGAYADLLDGITLAAIVPDARTLVMQAIKQGKATPSALRLVSEAFTSMDRDLRLLSVQAMDHLGDTRHRHELEAMAAADPDRRLKDEAAIALRRLRRLK